MNAKINNVIYKELYSGAKMVDDKYKKTNVAGSIDGEFTVLHLTHFCHFVFPVAANLCHISPLPHIYHSRLVYIIGHQYHGMTTINQNIINLISQRTIW
jgi:hypothetical protein